jgi:hypothetical protein
MFSHIDRGEHNEYIYKDEKGSWVLAEGCVFIRNRQGFIKYYSLEEFQASWFIVN